MTTFEQRERAFDNLFVNKGDPICQAHARRDAKLGVWAAGKLGKSGEAAAEYAQALVAAEIEGGDDSVFGKLQRDFRRAGVATSDQQIRRQMEQFLLEPRTEPKAA